MYTVTQSSFGAFPAYVLADTEANATVTVVPEKGGMIVSMTRDGEEYSWLRHPNFENPERPRCAVPVCFPMCGPAPEGGHCFEGRRCDMAVHGIVHTLPWQMVSTGTDGGASVTVQITDSEETRKSYPYAFRLAITYTLKGGQVTLTQTCENTGSRTMPFSFGFHPYFAITHVDNLDWDITACSVRSLADGSLSPFTGVDFPYAEPGTQRHYAGVQSPMSFTDRGSGHHVTVSFDSHFTNAVLWSQAGEGFVCMEPWNGFPHSLEGPEHENLAPGCSLTAQCAFAWKKV